MSTPKEKTPKVPTQLSKYIDAKWVFGGVSDKDLVKSTNESNYYRINTPFGLLDTAETDPSKTIGRGEAGDLLVIDRNNLLTIMSASNFNLFFNIKNTTNPQKTSLGSKALRDKDFYTKVSRNRPQ